MKTIRAILVSLVVLIGLSVTSYAYDIVQVTNTPDADESNPSIAIFGNTVYATWVVNSVTGSELYFDKSIDLGKTWGQYRKVIKTYQGNLTFELPKILTSQNGKIFILYSLYQYYGSYRYPYLIFSEDDGNNFSDGGEIPFSCNYDFDFAIDGMGNIIYVVGIGRERVPGTDYTTDVYMCNSFNGGNTFSETRVIFSVWWGHEIEIDASKDGKDVFLFLTHTEKYSYVPRPYFTKSSDYGETFSELKTILPDGPFLTQAIKSTIDNSGKIYLTWLFNPIDWSWAPWSIRLSESNDFGENFSTSQISDNYDWYGKVIGKPTISSIAVDDIGNVYSAFYKIVSQDLSYGLYFDKRIGDEKFNIDQYLGVSITYFSNKPMLVVTPDGKTAFIMWNNSETIDGNHDLFCITFPINKPPILNPIGNKEVNEGDLLEFTVSATDPDDDVLTYSAKYLPYGATFDSQTGVFSWRPEYFMGNPLEPINYEVRFTVSDSLHIDEETITITVNNTNRSPIITSIGNKSVNEESLLQFTVSASDPDGDTITYSMINAPKGATIDPKTGQFKWTPDYNQAGKYVVTFVASDGSLSAGDTITITVVNTNRPPILDPIGNKSVDEAKLLQFTVQATDPDGDTLIYSATNLPQGAAFNAITRIFTWTPTYTQAGAYKDIKFTASDGKLTATEAITITVKNVDRPPVLNPIGSKTIDEAKLLQFTLSATDPDSDPITYSANNLPKGAVIDSKTGQFNWTPDYSQTGSYVVTFIAGAGSLSDKEDVTIKVNNTPIPDLTAGAITYTVSGARFYTFKAPIKNIGDKAVTALFYVSLYVDGVKKNSTHIGRLGAGKAVTVRFSRTVAKGTHAIKIIADSTGKIKEADENNNSAEITIVVK